MMMMKMKKIQKTKIRKIVRSSLIIFICLLLCGCGKDKNIKIINMSSSTASRSDDPSYNINVNGAGTLSCTRPAQVSGLEGKFTYTITYKADKILTLHSIEKVSGNDSSRLDEFEEAYKKLKDRYKDVEYYNISVTRDEDSVIMDSSIDYDRADIDKIIEIEGNDNNLYGDDGKISLSKWYKFAKKVGTTCRGV